MQKLTSRRIKIGTQKETAGEKTVKSLKIKILEIAYASGGDHHIASAFSIMDILWILYDKILRINPKKPDHPERDIFILSKGHASLGLYATLYHKGFFDKKTFESFGKYDSILGGHPHRNLVPGVESSTGSLGHGMPIAVGVAMGLKIQKKKQNVYVLIGDGEANEGTIWESALLSSHHKLENLCSIVDFNDSSERALSLGDIEAKFKSFGWKTLTIDGHSHTELDRALRTQHPGQPLAIIARTIKGRGISVMKDNPAWHRKTPNKEEYEVMLGELK